VPESTIKGAIAEAGGEDGVAVYRQELKRCFYLPLDEVAGGPPLICGCRRRQTTKRPR
jgi:hypothetical protein